MFNTVKDKGIIVIGTGGHAKVIIEIFQAMNLKVDYCIGSLDSSLDECRGIPVLKGDDDVILTKLHNEGYHKIFIAIGSNFVRLKLAEKAKMHKFTLVNAISPNATLSSSVKMGEGIAIMAGAILNAETIIEDLVIINTGATVDHDCIVGKAAHIAPQCGLAGNVTVGTGTFIGIGTKIIPRVVIGKWSVIGAGTVVINKIDDAVTCMGVPGKVVKKCKEGINQNEKN